MGLFSKKETCSICGSNQGTPVADGFVCPGCWEKCGYFTIAPGQARKLSRVKNVEDHIKKNNTFKQTQSIRQTLFSPNTIIAGKIFVDEDNNLWCISTGMLKLKPHGFIYSFEDVKSYEIVEDGNSITKGGLGRAAVGGLAFGGVGAIVGSITAGKKTKSTCTKLYLNVKVDNAPRDVIVPYIISETKKSSMTYTSSYNQIQELLSYFNSKETPDVVAQSPNNMGNADEIKKYADLLAQGIISEEEFVAVKQKILGL
ncbi:SHOCT domain-containing protein [Candidatus Saccharibacteria bacterium]|nr:SHOCT domain-containing protein [Candidatus Saccharibacteria bacterium]